MNIAELTEKIKNGGLDERFEELYGADRTAEQRARYVEAIGEFEKLYGSDRDVNIYSVPGRSEICGNHTDHNGGCVIAASVNLDIIAVVSKNDRGTVTVKSKGFDSDTAESKYTEPDKNAYFTSASLISGTCAGFIKRGYNVGGFDCYTVSDVIKGSGISSSAAFEVMIGYILSCLYNDGKISAPVIAEIAQFAENVYFGKPSGLMDQTACAVGGFSYIDFGDPEKAKIEKLAYDMTATGYSLCLTNTGGNHADLNDDYASIPKEMKLVSSLFGKKALRGLTVGDLIEKGREIREKCGDRAYLRAYHFVCENERVQRMASALKNGNTDEFLNGILESGKSSFTWLQNVYSPKNPEEQGLSVALALTESVLSGTERKSAWRIHGGGFAGTVIAFVPNENVDGYRKTMNSVFGDNACTVLKVRNCGGVTLI